MALSKRAKTNLEILFVCLILVLAAIVVVWGMVNLWQNNEKRANERCAYIAKLAGDKEYLVDNWECYILNGNKIEKVN